jgi:acyl-CoA thioester hydrolase
MYSATTNFRVRYAETDQMGYVYYGNYAMFYEVGRAEALRKLGFTYKGLEDMGVMMPVLDLHCKFHKPALYDDLLTLKITIPEMPAVKMKFTYEITNAKGELINYGETTLVFVKKSTGRPTRLPDVMRKLFAPYYE